jgi:hypothetical protein
VNQAARSLHWENAGWKEMAAFSSCAPLSGLGSIPIALKCEREKNLRHFFNRQLWRNLLKLDTDNVLQSVTVQQTIRAFDRLRRSASDRRTLAKVRPP